MKKSLILKVFSTIFALSLVFAFADYSAKTAKALGEYTTETTTMKCEGASVRIAGDTSGVRFRIAMSTAEYESLGDKQVIIVIKPLDLIPSGTELTVADKAGDGVSADTNWGVLTDWRDFVNDDKTTDETRKQALAYFYGLGESQYNRPIAWRAYYQNEDESYVYSDMANRSLSYVALEAENDIDNVGKTELLNALKQYILNYNVTYNYNCKDNGEWKQSAQSLRYGSELPTPETVALDGYEFAGWDYDFTANTKVLKTVVANAQWKLEDGSKLTFDGMDDLNDSLFAVCQAGADQSGGRTHIIRENVATPTAEDASAYKSFQYSSGWFYGLSVEFKNTLLVPKNSKIKLHAYIKNSSLTDGVSLDINHEKLEVRNGVSDGSYQSWIGTSAATAENPFVEVNLTDTIRAKFDSNSDDWLEIDQISLNAGTAGNSKISVQLISLEIITPNYVEVFNGFEQSVSYEIGGAVATSSIGQDDNGKYLLYDSVEGVGGIKVLNVVYNNISLKAGSKIKIKWNLSVGEGMNVCYNGTNFSNATYLTWNGSNGSIIENVVTLNSDIVLSNIFVWAGGGSYKYNIYFYSITIIPAE